MLSTFQPHDGKKKPVLITFGKAISLNGKAEGRGIMFQGLNAV